MVAETPGVAPDAGCATAHATTHATPQATAQVSGLRGGGAPSGPW
jgi:hypothetical protein